MKITCILSIIWVTLVLLISLKMPCKNLLFTYYTYANCKINIYRVFIL